MARVDKRGRFTIPSWVRREYGATRGAILDFHHCGGLTFEVHVTRNKDRDQNDVSSAPAAPTEEERDG